MSPNTTPSAPSIRPRSRRTDGAALCVAPSPVSEIVALAAVVSLIVFRSRCRRISDRNLCSQFHHPTRRQMIEARQRKSGCRQLHIDTCAPAPERGVTPAGRKHGLTHGIERARADITEHDAKRTKCQCKLPAASCDMHMCWRGRLQTVAFERVG